MASTVQKTASTHRSAVVRGTHEFHIVGCSDRKRFASVTSASSIKSGTFLAGGHTWALVCSFDDQGHLASVTLELLGTAKDDDVVATAGIRIEDPLGEWPPAVWRSDDAKRFQPTTNSGRSWELSVPEAYHGHETSYVRDDRLTVQCTVDVLQESPPDVVETRNCFVSVVPPPTISQDLHKLLHVDMLGSSEAEERRRRCMQPDVTFVVEETEIGAHKLVLALRSPVFAAEFRWHRNQSATIRTRLSIDDMSASTFRAMIRFIYTDELPIKASNGTTRRARRREAMARDLLAAADRYDLERLRLMCQNILLEGIDTSSVMGTLLLVRGRQTCRQLEDSCIEYIASDPEVLAVVMATDEYQELKNRCSPLIIEIMERVATQNAAGRSDDIKKYRHPAKSWSTYNAEEVVHGVHEFRIPNFRAIQRRHGVGQMIHSGSFQVGDYDWRLDVYPSGKQVEVEGNISLFLQLLSHPPANGIKVSERYILVNGSTGKSPVIESKTPVIYTEKGESWGYRKFITLESVKSQHLAQDGSLTIYYDVGVTKQPYTSMSTPTTRAMIVVPSSNIALQLEELLVSEQGSDLMFLVEHSDICAHSIVIAARAPVLYDAVVAAANNKDGHIIVKIDGMKATVFKAVLHFVYTDELPPLGNSTVVDEDMLGAASRFGIERMKTICENFLAEHISKENAFDTLKMARRHHCAKLEEYCTDFILSVPPLAKELIKRVSLD